MDAAPIVQGMPPEPPRSDELTEDEKRKAINREYQRKSRAKKALLGEAGATGGSASPPRATPAAPLRVVRDGEKAAPKPADRSVPLSEGIRLAAIAPALADMAAKQMDDGRLAILARMEVPLEPNAPPRPLMAAFGASLDKAADLSGITLTALEAALLESAMLAFTMVGIYKQMPPIPYPKEEKPA